jgi:carboxyl-terminal processing protease
MKTIRSLLIATLLAWTWSGAAAPTEEPPPNRLPEARIAAHLAAFDQIWTTIQESHWDKELGGLDWGGLREELRPQIESATTDEQARGVMKELVRRLGQSHFAVLPGSLYDDLAQPAAEQPPLAGADAAEQGGDEGSTGIDFRVLDGQVVVTAVAPGSSAEAAGVRPGWIISEVAGEALAPLVERVRSGTTWQSGRELLLAAGLRRRLQGEVGSQLEAVLIDGADRRHEVQLELMAPRGSEVRLGYLPALNVWFESRLLEGAVGYIRFNAFFDPAQLMARFGDALTSFLEADVTGVVIDIRGNPGGIGGMAMGLAGWFVAQGGQRLGTMTTRQVSVNFVIFPRPRTFDGPLAVLVDGLSASTSEIFAGGLQDLGRARIFGSRTAGMALPSRVDRLANGDGFQYAFANYVSSGGCQLEGHGVVPDVELTPSRQALLAGTDSVLEAAVQWILAPAPASAGGPGETASVGRGE